MNVLSLCFYNLILQAISRLLVVSASAFAAFFCFLAPVDAFEVELKDIPDLLFVGRVYSSDRKYQWEVRVSSGQQRIIQYSYHHCWYVLVPSPERAGDWVQTPFISQWQKNSKDCRRHDKNKISINPEDDGNISINIIFSEDNGKFSGAYFGKLDTNIEFVKLLCPSYPEVCDLWTKSLEETIVAVSAHKNNTADDANKIVGQQNVPSDGKRGPLMGDWTNCGRPYVLKSDVPQDTSFNYAALSLTCYTDTAGTKWKLRIANLQFGEEYEILGAKPGMIISGVAKHNRGHYEIEQILNVLGRMKQGDVTKIYLYQAEGGCSSISCKDNISTVKRLRPGQIQSVRLTYADGNPFGARLELFANGEYFKLEELLELDSQRGLENNGGFIWNFLPGRLKDVANASVYKTRYASLITNYIFVRQLIHGDCGEPKKLVKWGTTRWTEYRNGFGHYIGESQATKTYEYFEITTGFDEPLNSIGDLKFDPEDVRLMKDVVQYIGCDNPVRRQIEQNMLTFYRANY